MSLTRSCGQAPLPNGFGFDQNRWTRAASLCSDKN